MEDNKRVLLAFALAFAVLLFWRVFVLKTPPPEQQPPASAPAGAQPSTPSAQPSSAHPTEAHAAQQSKTPVALAIEQGSQAQDIVVENDVYRVTFSSQGAVVKSWILKKYTDEGGKPLEVVNTPAGEQLGYPLSFSLPDSELNNKLNHAIYVVHPSGASLTAPTHLEFVYSDGRIQAKKEFDFSNDYGVQVQASVFNGEADLPVGVTWPGGFGDYSVPVKVREALAQVAYGSPEDVTTVSLSKLKEERTVPPPFAFGGLEDHYFIDMFLPESPDAVLRLTKHSWNPPGWTEKELPAALAATLGSPDAKPLRFRLFVAPKELDLLRAQNPPLDKLVDFGWFSVVAKPLFLGLRYIHDHWTTNWGWDIVLLTLLLNGVLFLPLRMKSLRSAQEMQKVGPVVKSIQDKYKQYKFNDPRKQKMQQEIMKVYQEHGVNPFGGCLPMLLQLPFLYGFYRLLANAIELRHAPWILWIKDLSAPDHWAGFPLPILPTVMIITMLIQQKMTPMPSTDPTQQRMMWIMPVVFGALFYNLASGLVLYYLTANLVGIAQQMILNRFAPAPQKVPVSPAVARARRVAGAKE